MAPRPRRPESGITPCPGNRVTFIPTFDTARPRHDGTPRDTSLDDPHGPPSSGVIPRIGCPRERVKVRMSSSEKCELCNTVGVEPAALVGYVECAAVRRLPRWIEWAMNIIDLGSGQMPMTTVSTTTVRPSTILLVTETRVFEFWRSRRRQRWCLRESYPVSKAQFAFIEEEVNPPSKIRTRGNLFYVDSGSLDAAKALAKYSWPQR